MAAKVVWYREAWWVRTRWGGNKKRDRRAGTTMADKRRAEKIAEQINARLALGTFEPNGEREKSLPCDAELRRWGHALPRHSQSALLTTVLARPSHFPLGTQTPRAALKSAARPYSFSDSALALFASVSRSSSLAPRRMFPIA